MNLLDLAYSESVIVCRWQEWKTWSVACLFLSFDVFDMYIQIVNKYFPFLMCSKMPFY